MKQLVLMGLAALVAAGQAHAENRRDLIRSCVTVAIAEFQSANTIEASASGGVTCPPADVVGFPPRERKHNRNGYIQINLAPGRVVCPGTVPSLRGVSDNGGHAGNFQFPSDRQVRVPISCSGAGLGQGRRWFNATLVVGTCPAITDDMRLDFTLDCAKKLK